MSLGWIPRGPLKGPVSNVGGKAEVGRPGTDPVVLGGGRRVSFPSSFPLFSPFFSNNNSVQNGCPLKQWLLEVVLLFLVHNAQIRTRFPVCVSVVLLRTCCRAQSLRHMTWISPRAPQHLSLLTQAPFEHLILAFTTRLPDTGEQLS